MSAQRGCGERATRGMRGAKGGASAGRTQGDQGCRRTGAQGDARRSQASRRIRKGGGGLGHDHEIEMPGER